MNCFSKRILITYVVVLSIVFQSIGQEKKDEISKPIVVADTIQLPMDTTELEPQYRMIPRSPKKASIMSALVPGLGQIYNHKYWKLPLIYGGFAAMTYGFTWNNNQFKDYKKGFQILSKDISTLTPEELAYLRQLIRNPNVNLEDPQQQDYLLRQLESGMTFYKRNRDLNVVGMAALYLLNIIDASIDAHFSTFDISDNLSMDVEPYATPDQMGVGIQFKF
ncbi:DUF5683 domain-containing protein [Prolixibacteraceae bacterium]|nr:DUF5683 domain-containing protein [Prolixibacteraceae bacterium]